MTSIMTKSILRRVFIYFALFTALVLVILYFLYMSNTERVPFYVFAGIMGVFIVYFLLVYLYEIVRPLKLVLGEMRNLLTGKKYKKIYTARVDEIGVIAHFFNEVTKSFEKVSRDLEEGKRMLGELEIASGIQTSILPPHNPAIPGLDIAAKTRSAVELGGDNFDFITKDDNTYIYIGDVTGHGVPAALIMIMVNTLVHTLVETYATAYEVVVNVNKQLKTKIKSTMFMTMLILRWNAVEKKMSFVGCGHEYLMIYRKKTGKCELTKSGGIGLGMVPDNSKLIKEIDIEFNPGDMIVLYTDGVTEGRNMSGDMYSLERLTEAVERFGPEYGADGVVNHVAKDYSQFVENHVQDDDVTLIVIHYKEDGSVESASGSAIEWAVEDNEEKNK